MDTCKSCLWWGVQFDTNEDGMSDCDFIDTTQGDKVIRIDTVVADDQGLSVRLMTHRSFGCNQHT